MFIELSVQNSQRSMRKDLPYKNVSTLIEICYVCVTYLLRECINLATIWLQLRKEFAKKSQHFGNSVNKAFIYLYEGFLY